MPKRRATTATETEADPEVMGAAWFPVPELSAWLADRFPGDMPLAERHRRVYAWFEALSPGVRPRPLIECWCRGGGKSTTVQRGVVRAGLRLVRHFCLYISHTQDQAEAHLQSIGGLFEREGIERLTNRYGSSKGWKASLLRTATGFNAAGIGLDVARRGIKLDEFRPDLIVIDDVDEPTDSARATQKKLDLITKALIPAGSTDCAIIFVQNMICEDGIMAQLVDGRADFLHSRLRPPIEPAVLGLETEAYQHEDGATRFRITAGAPTWSGQDLATCTAQINDWGLSSFLQEAQHEVHGTRGYFFDDRQFVVVEELPKVVRLCRAWDFAATQGGGDFTVGALIGISPNRMLWVLDVVRAQLASHNAARLLDLVTKWDRAVWGERVSTILPQDPGAAGKRAADEDLRALRDFAARAVPVVGAKASRARPWARVVNEGNARLLRDGHSRTAELDRFLSEMMRGGPLQGRQLLWNDAFIEEHRRFREDGAHAFDDQVDAAADAARAVLEEATVLSPHFVDREGRDRYQPWNG